MTYKEGFDLLNRIAAIELGGRIPVCHHPKMFRDGLFSKSGRRIPGYICQKCGKRVLMKVQGR